MAETNPFDALDDQTAASSPTETTASGNPFDALDDAAVQNRTASSMQDVTDQAEVPEVTVSAKRPRPEASWSQVAAGIPTAIGAGIETKVAGAQEFIGRTAYDDARKKFWQATILPQAVRDAKAQNVTLGELPEVQATASHLGIRPDVFTRDWPTYVNQSDDELNAFKTQQRDRIQAGAQQIDSGTRKRLTAQQVQEAYAPNMQEHSLKSLVFDAATMAPDLVAGVGGTVATGGIGGAAIMAADIAPSMYADARNRGLDHNQASTYAVLSTLASSVPEVPVLKIVQDTPLARKIIGSVIGEKLASTGAGKVAGTAAAQGVTQSVVNALQQGIDAGVLNEHLPLDEALKQVAWSGLVGSVVGAPMGAYHAMTSRQPKPTTLRDITEHPLEPTSSNEVVSPGEGPEPLRQETAPSVAPTSVSPDETRQGHVSPAPNILPDSTSQSEPISGAATDEHAALQATKDKTVTPPQAELLEGLGLVKRNDLGEPVLLPAGRRRLTQLQAEVGREKSPSLIPTNEQAEKEAETGPIKAEIEPETPVSPPEPVNEPSKSAEMEEKQVEVPEKAPQPPSDRASDLQKRLSDDQDLRSGLTAMKGETGWAQVGGRLLRDATTGEASGRTSWIPNAEWWPGRPKGLKESEVHAAIDKAVAGQPLKKREADLIEYMTQVHDERTAMNATHQELQQAVPNLAKQPEGSLDLTLLASRAAEFDPNEAARIMDTWEDDKPQTIARVRGEFEQIIGRGHSNKESLELTAQDGGAAEPTPVKRTPAALDLFGEDRTREQALADETRRRDALRSPNRDVPLETGLPGDLFSQSRRQVDFTDQLKQARAETHVEPTDSQKTAGNYRKGRLNFAGMEVAIENPKGSTRTGVKANGERWSREMAHDYGYIGGTKGHDGDHVDVFLTGKPDTGKAFVVNQVNPQTAKFDEHKAVLGAESVDEARKVYEANYPKGWKGEESIAELTTRDFRDWVHSKGPARGPIRPPSKLERRTEEGRRRRVAEMTAEELKRELLTHELTGIPNRRAYAEAEKLPHQVSIDVDSLKWVNDNMGHESGDELLKAIASSLSSHSDNVFHLSGDEFAAQAHTETEAHELMREVSEHLQNASIEVEMPDGRLVKLKGMGVSYGVGKTLEEADAALGAHKARRQAEGQRAERGKAPPGATVGTREEGRQDQTGGSAEGVEPKFSQRKSETLYRGESAHNRGGGFYTPDKEFARQFTQSGRDHEIRSIKLASSDIYEPTHDVYAGNPDEVDKVVEQARAAGKKAVRLSEGPGQPKSVMLVDKWGRESKWRRTEPTAGLPRSHVERIVHQTIREANLVSGFPHVEVHQDVSSLPEHIKSLIEQQGAQSLTGAVYDPTTGRIHIIAGNNGSEREVRENLWHEAVGHHGLRLAMDRPQYNAIMDGIARDMPERVEAAARRNGLDLSDLEQKRAAAEEVVAYAAGQHLSGQPIDKPVLPYWRRAVRAVKGFFSRMAGKPFYDDKAIAGLIQQARQALDRGTAGSTPGEPVRSTRAPVYYSPVERAVTESKQGKASADQWLATIKKMPGVKPEELEWLNLEPWLKEHKGSITREELADYVRANKLSIQETLHGAGSQTEDERQQVRMAEELRSEGYVVSFDNHGNLESIGVQSFNIDDFIDRMATKYGRGALFDTEGHTDRLKEDFEDRLSPEELSELQRYQNAPSVDHFHMHDPQEVEALPEAVRARAHALNDVSSRVALRWEAERVDPTATEDRGTRYGDYQLPGAQNYRELLLRLPADPFKARDLPKRKEVFDRYAPRLKELGAQMDTLWRDRHGLNRDEYARLNAERERVERERDAEADKLGPEQPKYQSGHWQEPNIVAHTRFNERTDADGKKVLFIEEVQSDWHQTGRSRGYRDQSKIDDLVRQNEAARAAYRATIDRRAQVLRADFDGSMEDIRQANREAQVAEDRQQGIERQLIHAKEGPPDAPFKTSWPMLVMKRMVRWAAENGFERIAWTTGQQQADRYDLSNHIDSITYSKQKSGKYRVTFMGKNGEVVGAGIQTLSEKELIDYVGEEVAQKIISEQGDITDTYGKVTERQLSGVDLKVGGEGMRGFYDDILPRETNKLIKKYGAKVGRTAVLTDRPDNAEATAMDLAGVPQRDRANYWSMLGPDEREALLTRAGVEPQTAPVHGFDITPEMKQAALGEGFPMFARRQQPLPLEENRERGAYAMIRRAVNAVHDSKAVRDVRKLANPVGMSPESKQTAQIARAALGELAHETVKTQEALEHFSRLIDKIPVEDQLRMMDEIERGVPQSNPEFQPVADEMRKILDTWREKVRGLGDGYLDNFIQNYFPHYWRDPSEAQRMVASIMGRRPLRGPASFLKMRTIPSIKEGMEAGLTPLTTNPLVMTLLKTREMQRFVTGVTLMRRFKEDGLAQFLRAGLPMPEGWGPINDNIAKVRQWSEAENGFIDRGQYIMPAEAARVINNHVSASALRDFAPAQIIRRGANALNAMQLGFSAFHLGFTTLDAMISKNAQGIERLLHGDVAGAAKSFGEGVTPVGAVRNVRRGYKLLQAYTNPAGATPEMAKLVQALEQAGGRAHMDRYYLATEGFTPFRGVGIRSLASDVHQALTAPQDKLERLGQALGSFPAEYANKLWRGIREITQTTPALEVPVEMAMRVVRASTSWIMEHLVPMQKLGVFSDLAADHLQRNPVQDPNERAAAMQRIWDSVDNRLGEMVYDNVFWNRTLKDSLHLAIRAVGWNLGTVREIGGAPVDLVKAIDKKIRTGELTAADIGHRIPYVLSMAATTALYAAVYQYMSTGQGPDELKDYFFPRTGGVTNYGTPERVSLPSYVKDIYEYAHRPGQTVVNKLNPIFSLMGNLYSNKDFFGNPITDPEAGYWKQKLQELQFVGREAKPFSFQGRQQMSANEAPGLGSTVRKDLTAFGVSPAPGYITSGEQMERRQRLEDDQKYTRELQYQMKRALKDHDNDKAADYRKQYTDALKRMNQTKMQVEQDRAKAAAARRKAAITMRQSGFPATANLVASLPLYPDNLARQYFGQQVSATS